MCLRAGAVRGRPRFERRTWGEARCQRPARRRVRTVAASVVRSGGDRCRVLTSRPYTEPPLGPRDRESMLSPPREAWLSVSCRPGSMASACTPRAVRHRQPNVRPRPRRPANTPGPEYSPAHPAPRGVHSTSAYKRCTCTNTIYVFCFLFLFCVFFFGFANCHFGLQKTKI